VRPAGVEELTEGDPREVVLQNALAKARAVEGERVLACDTEVNVDGRVLGKPADEAEARAMLQLLSGRMHEVLGGLVLRCTPAPRSDRPVLRVRHELAAPAAPAAHELSAIASTAVHFRDLDAPEIEAYVATGEWRGRAGGYAIQGRGAALVERIEGDFWNVVGLPVPELVRLLKTPC
jgi:septum formation protein